MNNEYQLSLSCRVDEMKLYLAGLHKYTLEGLKKEITINFAGIYIFYITNKKNPIKFLYIGQSESIHKEFKNHTELFDKIFKYCTEPFDYDNYLYVDVYGKLKEKNQYNEKQRKHIVTGLIEKLKPEFNNANEEKYSVEDHGKITIYCYDMPAYKYQKMIIP